MRLLLDTHALLWWLDDPALLGPGARAAIADRANRIFISAAVIWEIAIKAAAGRLSVRGDLDAAIAAAGFLPLSITIAHARDVAGLPPIHKDPFDRILIAQARVEGARLVSRDGMIARYPIEVILA